LIVRTDTGRIVGSIFLDNPDKIGRELQLTGFVRNR
jgi:hypothetical protein